MEVKSILLAESATQHPDGTFSLLRGGIDNWNVKNLPTQIGFSFIIVLELSPTEVGRQHTAELDLLDADGNRILPQVKAPFSISPRINTVYYKFNLVGVTGPINITRSGRFSLNISIDGHSLSSTEFQVNQGAQ